MMTVAYALLWAFAALGVLAAVMLVALLWRAWELRREARLRESFDPVRRLRR